MIKEVLKIIDLLNIKKDELVVEYNKFKICNDKLNELKLEKEILKIFNLINYFEHSEDDIIFSDFNLLSYYLNLFDLTFNEIKIIVFYILKKNIEVLSLDKDVIIIYEEDIKNYNFNYYSVVEINEIVKNNKLNNYLSSLTDCKKREELEEFISIYCDKNIDVYNRINNVCFKSNYMTNDNIEDLVSCLSLLKLDSRVILKIKKVLLSENQINSRSEDTIISKMNYIEFMSKKDFFKIKKNIDSLFNKQLTLNDQIFVISLMLKIGFNHDTITKFMKSSKVLDPILYYKGNINKYIYYENDCSLSGFIIEADSIVKELEECSSEDYDFWLLNLQNILDEMDLIISDNYEYEINCAKKIKVPICTQSES